MAKVVNYTVMATLETLETTSVGDHYRTYVPGILSYAGNATLMYYAGESATNTSTMLSKLFQTGADGAKSTDKVNITLGWAHGTDSKDGTLTLSVYITSGNFVTTTGDIVRADIAFQSDGKPTTATNL